VDWLDVLALAPGVVVAGGLAYLVSPLAVQSDPDMVWEARVAVGFAPLVYVVGGKRRPTQAAMVDAVRRGDPGGLLARTLENWRVNNALIAAHPTVAPHLPPAAEP
jgi:hypothetical protein